MKKIIRLTESDLNRIVKRVISENESVVDITTLLRKINGILVSVLTGELDNYVSDIKVKFGFNPQKQFEIYDNVDNILTFEDKSSAWEGATIDFRQPITYLKEINSVEYIDDIESSLSTEELTTFDQVGTIKEFPDKSLRDLMTNGQISLWVKPLSNPSIMTWKRLNVSSNSGDAGCVGVNAKYDKLGEDVLATDIFFLEGKPITKSNKICNGGVLISNSGIGIGFYKPINDIISTNK
jgi:hypothetical protein